MSFAGATDHFDMATTDLILISSTKVPQASSRADANDENNDIAASTYYGNDSGLLYDVTCTYQLKSGTLNTNTLKAGELSTGVFCGSLSGTTDNGDWPTIEASGVLGATAITAPTGYTNLFTLPSMTLTGIKQAQAVGFTVTEGCRLTGSGFSASVDLARLDDGEGEAAAWAVSGGVLEGTGDFVAVTVDPAWTVTLSDATETQAPGVDEPQAEYHTGSGTYEYILTRDAAT